MAYRRSGKNGRPTTTHEIVALAGIVMELRKNLSCEPFVYAAIPIHQHE
jgi:hypothetical protein